MASLASTLYAAFVADPTAFRTTTSFEDLPSDQRAAWERVAEVAAAELAPLPIARAPRDLTEAQRASLAALEYATGTGIFRPDEHAVDAKGDTVGVTFGYALTGEPDAHGDIIDPSGLPFCGVCLDGAAPCPVVDPPGVTTWTCLACGKLVGPRPSGHWSGMQPNETHCVCCMVGAGQRAAKAFADLADAFKAEIAATEDE